MFQHSILSSSLILFKKAIMKKFLHDKLLLAVMLFALTTANAQTAAKLSLVSVKGNKFMTAEGKGHSFQRT
jgi:hypothetical protein